MEPEKGKESAIIRTNERFHNLRFVVIVAGGLAMGMMMFLRLSITLTIVSMVNHTQLFLNEHPNATEDDVWQQFGPDHVEMGEFDWSNEVQEKIISFYMLTYMIFSFLSTRIIMKYGLQVAIPVCLAICALTNILTPVMSYWGWYWIVGLRLINGCAASGIVPGMIYLIESWTPRNESAMGLVIYQFTGNILSVLVPIIAGLLSAIHWKWAFYVPGIVSIVLCLFWHLIVSDSPESSKIISQKELDLIKEVSVEEKSNPGQDKKGPDETNDNKKIQKVEIPFHNIFKVKEFYSLAVIWSLYCISSGSFTMLLPNYVNRIYHVPVDQVGALTTFAQVGSLFSMLWPNRVVDFLMECRLKLSLTGARRAVVLICILAASSCLVCLAVTHSYLVVLVGINRFFHMTHDTVFLATVMSQFGPYGLSGPVYSVLNSLGISFQTTYCVLIGKLLDYTGETLECWSWMFFSIVSMNGLYLLIYTLFCHSNPVKFKTATSKSAEQSNC